MSCQLIAPAAMNHMHFSNTYAFFVADEEYSILPRSAKKNQLHEALESERFEDASRLIASNTEAYLVECFESPERSFKSCLHIIAGMSNTEQATKLCRELVERIRNAINRKCLLNMTTVDEFDMVGWKVRVRVAAIHIAAYNGNSGVVRLLCQEYGVDVNCSTSETLEDEPKKGITALEWAARKGYTEVVKALLDNKANTNVNRHNGVTPLYIAVQEGHTDVVKQLLHGKADVNASCRTANATPLHMAAWKGHREIAKLLLHHKANVNASTCTDGATPLYIAAQKGRSEIVKLLLAKKAKVNAGRADGDKPIDAARRNHHLEIVKLLQ